MWILGLKTERGGILIETLGGGRTELLGGMAYALDLPKENPLFVVKDSAFSATMRETVFDWGKPFTRIVEATQDGQTKILKKGDAPEQLGGTLLPLFSSGTK